MNTTKTFFFATLTALAATFGTSALAQEATPEPSTKAVSIKSRTQVAAELAQARVDGTSGAVSVGYDFVKPVASMKTRAEVRAELDAARASGELADLNSEAPDVVAASARGRKSSNTLIARGSAAR